MYRCLSEPRTDRQTDTDKQTDGQTDRQTDKTYISKRVSAKHVSSDKKDKQPNQKGKAS